MPSDTSEKGLESLIVAALTGTRSDAAPTDDGIRDPRIAYGGTGYVLGDPQDYDRDHAVDLAKLLAFLHATQPKTFEQLGLAQDGPPRLKFLARLQGEIA
jgi:type I restriction enzyme R subunit